VGYVWPRKVGTVASPENERLSYYALMFHAELLSAKGRPFTSEEFAETARQYRERRTTYQKAHGKAEEKLGKEKGSGEVAPVAASESSAEKREH
jgi:hypothetical protein